jgi:hypothetical protein
VGPIVAVMFDIFKVFALFGGGRAPELPRKLQHGPNNLYPEVTGINPDLTANESPSAPKMCGDPRPCDTPPLQKQPASNACRLAALHKLHVCEIHGGAEAAHIMGGITAACMWAAGASIAAGPEGPPIGGGACALIANIPSAIGFGFWGAGCAQQYQKDLERCGQ